MVNAQVVGDGTRCSCTKQALQRALDLGGPITFNCGPAPISVVVDSELIVTKDTVIDGANLVTLDGLGNNRILGLHGDPGSSTPALVVQNLVFVNGRASGTQLVPLQCFDPFTCSPSEGTAVDGSGGAIYHLGGTLKVLHCVFDNDQIDQYGPDLAGGAVFGEGRGSTIIENSVFVDNVGSNGGAVGAYQSDLVVSNSSFTNNQAVGVEGNQYAWVLLARDGGRVYLPDGAPFLYQTGLGGEGGAISLSGDGNSLTVCATSFSGNACFALGGAVSVRADGGALARASVDRSDFDSNAIINQGLSTEAGGVGGRGGAIYAEAARLTVTNSTIANSVANAGGGLFLHGGSLTLTNSTLASNVAAAFDMQFLVDRESQPEGLGGGLYIDDAGSGTLENVTIASNWSDAGPGGLVSFVPLTIRNSILANNGNDGAAGGSQCGFVGQSLEGVSLLWPPAEDAGGSDTGCGTGFIASDPLLGQLRDNGGPTPTLAVGHGSPALDAGTNCPAADQTGAARAMAYCTLGAVEAAR